MNDKKTIDVILLRFYSRWCRSEGDWIQCVHM